MSLPETRGGIAFTTHQKPWYAFQEWEVSTLTRNHLNRSDYSDFKRVFMALSCDIHCMKTLSARSSTKDHSLSNGILDSRQSHFPCRTFYLYRTKEVIVQHLTQNLILRHRTGRYLISVSFVHTSIVFCLQG